MILGSCSLAETMEKAEGDARGNACKTMDQLPVSTAFGSFNILLRTVLYILE